MEVAQLNLPARYAAGTHFKTACGAAHYAAEELVKMATADGTLAPATNRDGTRSLLRSLQEALCAARELDNLLAGNQPPRRGDA
jgi:hypothetical protein